MVKRFRKSKITFEEIVDDIIFLFIAFFLSFVFIFIFDIHHSFYEKNFFPLKFIFENRTPYVIGTLLGGIIGFFLIKLFLFALHRGTMKKIKFFVLGELGGE
jgi:lysylphosphatidylglycerol synthetase-like protein (DUF2156 family)